MRAFQRLLLVATVCSVGLVQAQFPLINSSPNGIYPLGSLSSGVHYIDILFTQNAAGSRTVYNTDLSVHRVLNFPAPPAGMQWSSMRYITDELFDTDPGTIEFVMTATVGGPGNFGTFVYREDGTELFSQNPGSMVSGIGGEVDSFGPIYTTDEGTFMVVHTAGVWGPPVNTYQLPGTLPCRDCYNTPQPSMIGTGGTTMADMGSGMTLFPNPAARELQVRFDPESRVDRLVIIDVTGREVLSQPTNGGTSMRFDISHLAVGQYTVISSRKTVRVGALPLVVVR